MWYDTLSSLEGFGYNTQLDGIQYRKMSYETQSFTPQNICIRCHEHYISSSGVS